MKTRKILTAFFAIALCVVCMGFLAPEAQAAEQLASGTCGDSLTWVLTDDGTLTISGTGDMSDFDDMRNKAPWSYRQQKITRVVINEGVTSIGNYAFWEFTRLTDIHIPDGVTKIGKRAFDSCGKLTSVTIPDSVINMGSYVFYKCGSLSSVKISNHLQAIGECAFSGCSNLTSVIIPDSVTYIAYGAFFGCTGITSITIPDSVTSVGQNAFGRCSSLQELTMPYLYGGYIGSIFTNYSDFVGNRDTPKSLTSLVLTKETMIGPRAFYGCTSLTSIILPDSIASIGLAAFSCCTNLTSITIPSNITSLPEEAFISCESLTSISLPANLKTIGRYAFCRCKSLRSISIPDRVNTINDGAFKACTSLTSITIPSKVTRIGEYAFSDCSKLTEIRFQGDYPTINAYAFYNLTTTAYYPAEYHMWISFLRNYGGKITWSSYNHTYNSDCDISCNICGAIRETDPHSDANNDYFCDNCNDKFIPAQITGVSITVDGKTYTEGNVIITPSSNIVFTFTGTNFEYLSDKNLFSFASNSRIPVTRLTSEVDYESNVAVFNPSSYFLIPGSIIIYTGNHFQVSYSNDAYNTQVHTDIFLTYHNPSMSDEPVINHVYTSIVTAPDCKNGGCTTYTCICGDTYSDNYTDPLGHDFSDWAIEKDADCIDPGQQFRCCSVCNEQEIQAVPALGHQYESGSCTRCGAKDPSFIPGDANGDGKADYSDALLILRYSIGLETLTPETLAACDVNHDGDINYSDALMILRASIGLETLS